MPGQHIPVRGAPGDHHPCAQRRRIPPVTLREPWGYAPVSIDLGNEPSWVRQVSLELDDEQGSRTGVPCKDVDAAVLSEPGRRHLGFRRPVSTIIEKPGDALMHRVVSSVDDPCQVAATERWLERDADLEDCRDGPDVAQAQALELAGLRP